MNQSTYEGRWLTTKQMADVLSKHPLTLVRKAKKLVKDVLISNGFKLVSEDDQNKQMVGRRKVNEGFVTIAVYFYSASSSTKLRLVTQVPRNGTAYYRIHEQIIAELI